MNKTKYIIFAITSVIVLLGVGLFIIKSLESAEVVSPEDILGKDPVEILSPQAIRINSLKSRALVKDKYELNKLSKDEQYEIIDLIRNDIKGKRISDIPKDAYYFEDGKVIFKIDYFINKL